MKERRKKSGILNWKICVLLTLIIVAVIIIIIAIIDSSGNEQETETQKKYKKTVTNIENVMFAGGIEIVDSGSFTGTFVEDGSDEKVEDIAALTVRNTSDTWLEYTEIVVSNGKETFEFSVSALPMNATVRVLEKEKKQMTKSGDYDIRLKNTVFYKETPSLYSDIFEIKASDQQITVKNISQRDITGDIYVYYKYKLDDIYIGGIAYRVKLEGGLVAGEEAECYAGHYLEASSKLLFVTYVE